MYISTIENIFRAQTKMSGYVSVEETSSNFEKLQFDKFEIVRHLGKSQKGNKKVFVFILNSQTETPGKDVFTVSACYAEGILQQENLAVYKFYKVSRRITGQYTPEPEVEKETIIEIPLLNTRFGVYLMEAEYSIGTCLKIGFSEDCIKRYESGRTMNIDLRIHGYINDKNYSALEDTLHKKFSNVRYKREWFLKTQEIMDYFQTHKLWVSLK